MSKVDFFDRKVRKNYEVLIEEERCIEYILDNLEEEYDSIMVCDVLNKDKPEVILNTENGKITLSIDREKNITSLSSPNWKYQIIYENIIRKNFSPLGKKYEKDNRSVLVTYPIDHTLYRYKFEVDSRIYEISISREKTIIDNQRMVDLLLNLPKLTGILDIYAIVRTVVSFPDIYLKIKRNDDIDCGSMLIFNDGKLSKYTEYFNNGYLKLYYDGNKILEEITKQVDVEEEYHSYVKKIGERNG